MFFAFCFLHSRLTPRDGVGLVGFPAAGRWAQVGIDEITSIKQAAAEHDS